MIDLVEKRLGNRLHTFVNSKNSRNRGEIMGDLLHEKARVSIEGETSNKGEVIQEINTLGVSVHFTKSGVKYTIRGIVNEL